MNGGNLVETFLAIRFESSGLVVLPKLLTNSLIALQIMMEGRSDTVTTPPKVQKLERLQTIEKEHKDALERAVSLNIPHAATSDEEPDDDQNTEASHSQNENSAETVSKSGRGRTNWDEVVEKLYKKKASGSVQ